MTTDQASPATTASRTTEQDMPPGSQRVINLLLIAAFVVILNETIMSVALPRLMVDLDITTSTAQWLTTGFMLTMAVVIPATGFILQRFHLRPVFITAMTLFSIGTFVAAMAPGFGVLLTGRVLQASGTAIMMPLLMTTVLNLVPASKRGRTMGTISIVMAVAPAIGPTMSGLILSVLDWRWMFWIVLPIALIALALGALMVKNVTTPRKVAFDAASVILSAFAFGGLIYGLASIGESAEGNAAVPVWVPLVVGVLALALFIVRQISLQRTNSALMDLRTFTTSAFTIAIVLIAISMMALFGSLILLPLYLQNVLELSTLTTGLMLLPGGVAMAIIGPIVGRLFDRFGPRPLVIPGAVVLSAALWSLTALGTETSIGLVIVIHVVMSAGIAFMLTPLLTTALGSLKKDLYSHGSAIVGTVQQLAGAAGTALFITVMTTQIAARIGEGAAEVSATAEGVQAAFMYGAVISILGIIVSFFVKRPANALAAGTVIH